MIKGNSLLKKRIVTHKTESIVGYVEDVLIDPFSNRLAAFVTNRQYQQDMMVVPRTGIRTIEPDQVIIWASSMVVRARELFEIQQLLRQGMVKQSARFRTTDGHFLGAMADYYIDERNGALVGYEVFGGELAGGDQDRGFLPAPDLIAIEMRDGLAHIRPMTFSPPGSHQPYLARLVRAIEQLNTSDAIDTDEPAALAQQFLTEIVGCPAQHTVTTQDGYVIVVEGQIMTNAVIQYARQKHSEIDLLLAVNFDLMAWLDELRID